MSVVTAWSCSWWRRCAAVVAVALGAAMVPGASVAAAQTDPGPGFPAWVRVPGAKVTGASVLASVQVFSSDDAWAVGTDGVIGSAEEKPLTTHWDGAVWNAVPSPGRGSLHGVSGTSGTDVWAVGNSGVDEPTASIVLHWNGAQWREVPHVSATPEQPLALGAVAAVTPEHVWAVGFRGTFSASKGHAQFWNGTSWRESLVPQPDDASVAMLTAVAGRDPSDVWAAGFTFDVHRGFRPYFVHWNGAAWSLIDVPPAITGGYNDLRVLGGNRIVAVGGQATPGSPVPSPRVATLVDGVWKQESLPPINAELNGVAADRDGGIWVVGDQVGSGHDDRRPLTLRGWGGQWSVVDTPVVEAGGLRAVAVLPDRAVRWAVGTTGVTNETQSNLVLGTG